GLYEYVKPAWQERPHPQPVEEDLKIFGATVPSIPADPSSTNFITVDGVKVPSIDHTYKLYYGGAQKRPDGNYSRPVRNPSGDLITVVGDGNRKDIRNAVEAAHKAAPGYMFFVFVFVFFFVALDIICLLISFKFEQLKRSYCKHSNQAFIDNYVYTYHMRLAKLKTS
ncbi:aldehyde dehydrogenase family 16 member A1-like, partial [Anneissia japonica]|uniref:aldehyde dehydrogenase family 16 member A1-like n=1 Tax=Anneissia japonica TaxID=1529436 RepID=UPI001425B37E